MDTEEIHMAGYLEKLPMNKKKVQKIAFIIIYSIDLLQMKIHMWKIY